MKKYNIIIIPLLIALATGTDASAFKEHSRNKKAHIKPPAGFIYREGNKLMLNGKQYQSASFNSFQLSGCGHDYEVFTDLQIDTLFASLPDNIMIRTWAFPGNTVKIDKVIKLAEQHNVKLLLTLADGRSHCGHLDGAKDGGGSGKQPEWYTTGFRKQYLRHVTYMSTTYKNSPAIGMWEIINEPGDADWKTIKQFFDEVSAEIKKNDPNHLVCTGSWAPWAYDEDAHFQIMHENPNIDVGSLHEYDYDYNNSNTIESPHFAGALSAMNNLNKVLIVGETGIESGDSCRTDIQTRVNAMKQKFDVYLNKGAGVVLVWNLAQYSKGCGFTFPVTDPLLDMIKTYPLNLKVY